MASREDDQLLLSYACEYLKDAPAESARVDGVVAASFLIGMAVHESSLVREGAVYGMAGHLANDNVKMWLESMAENDRSEGVRAAARDVLSDLEVRDASVCGVWFNRHNRCLLPKDHPEDDHTDGDRCIWRRRPNDSTVRPQRSIVRRTKGEVTKDASLKVRVAQFCVVYDRSQTNGCHSIARDCQHEIAVLVEEMMGKLVSGSSVDRAEASAELTYFNTWFASRGGWRDGLSL